ncbi:Uroporphyrinogen decarboxylase (URO-D) [Acetitomaculum ruminis DSM 5522]|uniref:Uroporphyrinogen decarboxylase (URO-D) n=1 Tax=Acetitomaculum ruminis DSM 5522 TaxID=1120918 RepID=A0A1I0Z3K0_9FIRM|nr:uroporphyrinogen decarboxylase family protein [Acetitomaculum ruminis]SFB18843.1 Uroporphyrinogen decarboxylase (URO-D) [Acetitomaculum ruminis DSM 5522]
MLTKKQNLLETIRGGKPDRIVNQFEYVALMFDPCTLEAMGKVQKGGSWLNGWGVRIEFPENVPGMFPDTSPEHVVIKDIVDWKKYVKAPNTKFSDEAWQACLDQVKDVDRNEVFIAPFVAPGIFEKIHYLMGMEEAMINFYEEPEAMHELIEYLTDYELDVAKEICDHLHPDALFHHDDWGSQLSSFLSPAMFEEFIEPAYKKIYGYYKEHGVELIVHHSDSYGENLIPSMIRMGIDIWQGIMSTNNIKAAIENYGGKISFQGGIDNGKVDREDWTKEKVWAEAKNNIDTNYSGHYFIPATVMGEPGSIYPGVYDAVSEYIAKVNAEKYGIKEEVKSANMMTQG